MKRRKFHNLFLLLIIFALFIELGIIELVSNSKLERLKTETICSEGYRAQELDEEMLDYISKSKAPGEDIGIYLLETKFGYQEFSQKFTQENFVKVGEKWKEQSAWDQYCKYNRMIWDELEYFPIPEFVDKKARGVSYQNSWQAERSYGGRRFHEGTDLMARDNVAGIYPVVSMTDGIVRSKGWLEKGGYRIGVEAPSGAYFYYAHLHSYGNVEIGDEIQAGTILGFMGDSGYGPEGTTGKFPVHLHVGVYIYPNEKEMSVNPYWLLRYLENRKIKIYEKS